MFTRRYRKAIAGAIGGAVAALIAAAPGGLDSQEWWAVLTGALVGSGLVAVAPRNDYSKPTRPN